MVIEIMTILIDPITSGGHILKDWYRQDMAGFLLPPLMSVSNYQLAYTLHVVVYVP